MGQYVFKLPDVGEGTVEAEIGAWRVAVGDRIEEDDPLIEMMTEKVAVEIPSPVSGKIIALHGQAGDMVAVGSEIAVIETQEQAAEKLVAAAPAAVANVAAVKPSTPQAVATQVVAATTSVTATAAVEAEAVDAQRRERFISKVQDEREPALPRPTGEREMKRVRCSPAVRHRARELGVELQSIDGTGRDGRISQQDLTAYVERTHPHKNGSATAIAASDAITEIKIIGLRRKIAEKMQESKRRIPHFSYVEEVDVTELERLRRHLNSTKSAAQPKLTLLPFFIRALGRLLPQFPQINSRFDDDAGVLRRYAAVHVGIATQTPTGLVVPVMRNAGTLSIWAAAQEILRLAEAARTGKATVEEMSGGTITLTSLGPLGGLAATPVINYPEVAIIGPNRIIERPVVVDGQIAVRKMMNISSSFDHRIVDGYDAAAFIQKMKGLLENPATLFME